MRSTRAFTLVEIMVVVLILAIISAVAVPQWFTMRGRSQQRVCMSQLRAIDGAKEMFAGEARLAPGDVVRAPDLWPTYLKGNAFPRCPGGGVYSLEPVGQAPQCTLGGLAQHPHSIR